MKTLAEGERQLKRCRPGRGRGGGGAPLPALILMTDRVRLPDPAAAIRRLPAGSAVIFRDYDAPDRATAARCLQRLCRARRIRLLIAGDWRLAAALRADGLHLPEALAGQGYRTWRRARRPGFLVTQAAHGPAAVALAGRRGVDAVLLSPVFATASHPNATPLGPLRFARLVRLASVPVYALGGVTAKTRRRLAGIPIAGYAAIGALVPPSPPTAPPDHSS